MHRLNGDALGRKSQTQEILAHLRRLLNTRQGDAQAHPSYGLADTLDLRSALPGSGTQLAACIAEAICRHEPRLTDVQVRRVPNDDPLMLVFSVCARLADAPRPTSFFTHTHMRPDGRLSVAE